MKKYEFQIVFLDRLELRSNGPAFVQLNAFGADGWRIVHVREDAQHAAAFAFILEREVLA
jgi:hypothetical protein